MFTFNSKIPTLTVVLKPSRRIMVGTQVVVEPGESARFSRGLFTTEDAAVAELLRAVIRKTKDNIVELTHEDELAFEKIQGALNQRGPISAASLGKSSLRSAPTVAETVDPRDLSCPICDPPKQFKNQRSLNLHLVSHRPGVNVAEKPTVIDLVPIKGSQTQIGKIAG